MATRKKPPVKVKAAKPPPSLGVAQEQLEASSRELRSAQKAYRSASERLATAEEAQNNALATLNATLFAVKSDTKVIPLHAQ